MKEIHDFKPLLIGMDRNIPDYIIDRGIEYYEQGLVEDVQIKEPWIHATVLGNYGDYNVQVHMTDFKKSRCNCPYGDYCKHMAAVVYYVTREYAGEPGFNEPAGGPCAYAADVTDAVAAETSLQQPSHQPDDDLDQCLKSMGKEDLIETIKRLMETDPSLCEKIRLILVERDRSADLHSDRVRRMGLYSSLKYYQQRAPRRRWIARQSKSYA